MCRCHWNSWSEFKPLFFVDFCRCWAFRPGMNLSKQLLLLLFPSDRAVPCHIKFLRSQKVVHISCGDEHTAALTKVRSDRICWTELRGSRKTTRKTDDVSLTGGRLVYVRRRLVGSAGSRVHQQRAPTQTSAGANGNRSVSDHLREVRRQMSCRVDGKGTVERDSLCPCVPRHHTLAFVPSSGLVYSFGCNSHGQLGTGIAGDARSPFPIKTNSTGRWKRAQGFKAKSMMQSLCL